MRIKTRFVAFLLIFAVLSCRLCIVNVNAAQGVGSDNVATTLTGLRITDLSKPVAGKTLDFTARVRTNENVTWEIPVIWVDDQGNTATVAEPGKTYIPNFVFYVPAGYTINADNATGQFKIKLPDFLTSLFGSIPVVFVSDASKGITYITFTPALLESAMSSAADASKSDLKDVPAVYPGSDTAQTVGASEPESGDTAHSTDAGNDQGAVRPGGGPDNGVADADELPEQVVIHCSESALENISPDVLEEIITLIKNKLEPQAVNLLKNSFPAYKNAPESALGKEIGLYVYYRTGSVDDGAGISVPVSDNAFAYVIAGYQGDNTDMLYQYVIAVNTSSFVQQDPDTGAWKLVRSENHTLSNTIIHEMMHAFMDDYTRRGMSDNSDGFPVWFEEGIASAVENIYQLRAYQFQTLGNAQTADFDSDLKRYTMPVSYSNSGILEKYTDPSLKGDYRYDLTYSDSDANVGSAYVSGYLAIVYLGYLTAMRDGMTGVVTFPEDENAAPTIDIDKIRYGTNRILEMLHDGYSLDSIIRCISATDANDTNPYYTDTDDFSAKFIKGDGEDSVMRNLYEGNESVMGSLAFCSYYLNYLESQSAQEGDYTHLANGSILSSAQDYVSPLDPDSTSTSNLYTIVDSKGFVPSTADNDKAWNGTGGTRLWHRPDGPTAEQTDEQAEAGYEPGYEAAADAYTADGKDITMEVVYDEPAAEAAPPVTGSEQEPPVPAAEPEPAIESESVTDTEPVSGLEPVTGLEPDVITGDAELDCEEDTYTLVPHDEDALLPDNEEPATEPVTEDSGDGDGHDDTPSDSPSDDVSDVSDQT